MGFPWALALALGLLVAWEVVLHSMPRMKLIAYASDEGQYHAVRDTIDALGPAEIALVGSSQMREGVVMPTLIDAVEKRLGRRVVVSNYAVRGARLDVMAAIVDRLQRQEKPPAMIIVGVSPRDLRSDTVDWPRAALFWDWQEWWHNARRYGSEALDVLPVMVRNEAGRAFLTLRYREEIALTVRRLLPNFGVSLKEDGNPILGELTDQHAGGRGQRTLLNMNKSMFRRLFDRADDTYLFDLPAKPRPAMRSSLIDLAEDLKRGPGKGLLVEMPVADFLRNEIDRSGQGSRSDAAFREAAGRDIPFFSSDAQPFKPTDEHFVDLQHLNRVGAEMFSLWLADEIAARFGVPVTQPTTFPVR